MPAQLMPAEVCGSWFGNYTIKGSQPGTRWIIELRGAEGEPYHNCPAWRYFKGELWDRTCKHMKRLHDEACLWNPQWDSGRESPTMVPETYSQPHTGSACPSCGGPMVGIMIAV